MTQNLDQIGRGDEKALANNLLRALRPADLALIQPHLEPVQVNAGDVLFEPGDDVRHAHFPCGPSLLSFVVMLEDGRGVETALIGREGAVGGIVSHGRLPAYSRALVQFPGLLLRIGLRELEAAKTRSPTLNHLFARYADCVMAQVFQSVACNAAHSIEQRTAKWILAALDRTGDHEVPLTQEQLASMLGVGRSYISRIIQSLKAQNLLRTRRGAVLIADMDGLRAKACGCNDSVRRHFDEVLSGVYPGEAESTEQQEQSGRNAPRAQMRG